MCVYEVSINEKFVVPKTHELFIILIDCEEGNSGN